MRGFSMIFSGILCSALLLTTVISPLSAEAAKNKKSKSSQKKVVAPEGVPTVLPAFKGPKKIKIDFTDESNTADNNKVVPSNSALDQAISDNKAARTAVESNNAKIEIVQSIPVAGVPEKGKAMESVKNKPVASPSPAQLPIASKSQSVPLSSPTPTPAPMVSMKSEEKLSPTSGPSKPELAKPDLTSSSTSSSPSATVPNSAEKTTETTPETKAVTSSTTTANETSPTSSSNFTPASTSSRWSPNFIDSSPRFYLRGGYLGAKYSDLESRLENGATMIGFGLGAELRDVEGRISIDIVHGKDQAVTPQNIRMITARVDANFLFLSGPIRPFVGGGLGYSDYDVRSYRSVNGNDMTIKQHAKGSALSALPHAGVRFSVSRILSVNLELEYQALLGKSEATSLGGLSGIGSVGFTF